MWADPTTLVAQTSAWLDSMPSCPILAWANSAPRFGPNLVWDVVIQTLRLAWVDSTPSLSPTLHVNGRAKPPNPSVGMGRINTMVIYLGVVRLDTEPINHKKKNKVLKTEVF